MSGKPNNIRAFELKLEANWSSENVVQMLTPDFVGRVLLPSFPPLEPTIKMRALIAFLGTGAEQLASLQDHLVALLRIADDDKDEWVQIVSGLVRRNLVFSEDRDSPTDGGPEAFSANILRKAVAEVLSRADGIVTDRAGNGEKIKAKGGASVRYLLEAPYFSPLEERFVSRKQQRPKKDFENPHFSAKGHLLKEFSEDIAPIIGGASSSSPPSSSAPINATSPGLRAAQGGIMKPAGTSLSPTPAEPNLAQARRVSLAATDPAAGSDGLRRTSKPLALARNHAGVQKSGGGPLFGNRKSSASAGGVRGVRGGGGAAGGGKTGLMMINVDDLQAIHAEKEIAKERAKGKPGRKKAKISNDDEQETATVDNTVGLDGLQQPPRPVPGEAEAHVRPQEKKAVEGKTTESDASPAKPDTAEKAQTMGETAVAIPQQGEIEAMAAMMVLGVGGGDKEVAAFSLPETLTKLLEDANSLKPEGKAKLEGFFQKKAPEGSTQDRVKYHEEISPGAEGEMMRVTSYIRLDYDKWVWDRVHKMKRVVTAP